MADGRPKRVRYIAGGLFIAGITVGCVFLVRNWQFVVRFQQYGYLGLFLVTFITGSPPPVPVPYMILIPTFGAILRPGLVGLVSGVGLTSGAALLYLTGRGGRRMFPMLDILDPTSQSYSSRIAKLTKKLRIPDASELKGRRGFLIIVIASVVPNPFFAPMVISMGVIKYRFSRFFLACLAGQTAKSMVLAYIGNLGLRHLLGLVSLPPHLP
jgi:membrane protein DedA with SNARE-associated domain